MDNKCKKNGAAAATATTKKHHAEPTNHSGIDNFTTPLLLSEKQACEYLGVSLSLLRKSRMDGNMCKFAAPPFVRLNGRIYYRRKDIDEWAKNLEARHFNGAVI